MRITNKFNWIISIPIKTKHAALRIVSYVFKKFTRLFFYWIKVFIILISALMIRKNPLIILTVTPSVQANNILDILRVILLLYWIKERFDCKGYSKVVFV